MQACIEKKYITISNILIIKIDFLWEHISFAYFVLECIMSLQWEIVKSIEITRRNTPYMLMKMSDKIRETAFYCFISPEGVPYERV